VSSTTKNRVPTLEQAGKGKTKSKNGRKKRGMKMLDDWKSWSKHLGDRNRPVPVAELVASGKKSPLLWALPQSADGHAAELVKYLNRLGSQRHTKRELVERLEQWLDQPRELPTTNALGYECLAWSHALPSLAGLLAAGPWWQLLERLTEIAAGNSSDWSAEDPLAEQLLAGELPLTLAYLFPEVERCRDLVKPACRTISAGLHELLDGEGLPAARDLQYMRPLMASWLRSSYLDREMTNKEIDKDAALQLDWLVRQAIRTARHDGSQMLCDGWSGQGAKRLFEASLAFTGDNEDRAIAGRALSNGKAPSDKNRKTDLPESDAHSEWAEVAILRSDWSRSSQRLLVTYGERNLTSELCSGRSVIWSGPCDSQIRIGGQTASPTGDWEEVCWHTDEDVSYLELECPLTAGWKVQRQWLLARKDRFLFVADAMISNGVADQQIEYRCTWPLADGNRFTGAAETREGVLGDSKARARVIPAALPEWRCERLDASLGNADGGVQLFQTGRGRALYAPLFVDLSPRRLAKPLTWRHLTVAEKLQIQPPDVAAGYRIQVGKSQWLIYRSLTPAANRTVLGQNLSTEFFIGRFKKSGDTKELLEIA